MRIKPELEKQICHLRYAIKDAYECDLPNGEYQKHFIYLNDWTMYTVEQVDSTKTDKFNYEFNFLPQELPGVKITSKD